MPPRRNVDPGGLLPDGTLPDLHLRTQVIGAIDFNDPYHRPTKLFDPLSYQVGKARRISYNETFRGPWPRTLDFQDLATWLDDNDFQILAMTQTLGRGNYRAIIGLKPH